MTYHTAGNYLDNGEAQVLVDFWHTALPTLFTDCIVVSLFPFLESKILLIDIRLKKCVQCS